MPNMIINQNTTLEQLQRFADTVPDGHQLRAVTTKSGAIKLYSKDSGARTLNTKADLRPQKFNDARQAIRTVMGRGAGNFDIEGILNGIYWPGTHAAPGGATALTGAELRQELDQANKAMDRQQREQQGEALHQVDTPAILGRAFQVSSSGGGGVIFANGNNPGELNVVLKFDSPDEIGITDRLFQALDQVKDLRGDFPFDFGRHEAVVAGGQKDALVTRLGQEIGTFQDRIRDLVDRNGIERPDPLFDEHQKVDFMAGQRIQRGLGPEQKSEFRKLEGQLARLSGMQDAVEQNGQFSKYTKLEGRPLDSLSRTEKQGLILGQRFPQEMGKGGMIGSLLGLKDHCGNGNANLGNFLISDSGKLSIVDIVTDNYYGVDGDLIGHGVRHQNMIDECNIVTDLIKDGKLKETLQAIATDAKNDIAGETSGGVARFAQAILGPEEGDRLFERGQGDDRAAVVDGMKGKDQIRLLANYLKGAYEGMRFILENKDAFKQMIADHGLGIVSNDQMAPDPDLLLDSIEQAFTTITPKDLKALDKLT